MPASDELPYFGTRDNPTNVADDADDVLDVTITNELSGLKCYFIEVLNDLKLDVKQPAEDVKIEAIANEKVRNIINPVIVILETKIKGAQNNGKK